MSFCVNLDQVIWVTNHSTQNQSHTMAVYSHIRKIVPALKVLPPKFEAKKQICTWIPIFGAQCWYVVWLDYFPCTFVVLVQWLAFAAVKSLCLPALGKPLLLAAVWRIDCSWQHKIPLRNRKEWQALLFLRLYCLSLLIALCQHQPSLS